MTRVVKVQIEIANLQGLYTDLELELIKEQE